MGYNGLEVPVRLDAKRMALGRQNMYFSIFMGWMALRIVDGMVYVLWSV